MRDRASTLPSQTGAQQRSLALPRWMMLALAAMILAGAAAFLLLVYADEPLRAWCALLTNFLFWNGAAAGVVAVAAIFEVSRARWSVTFRHLMEACVAFLFISLGAFALLCLGWRELWSQSAHWRGDTGWWRSPAVLLGRDAGGLLTFSVASLCFSRAARKSRILSTDSATARRWAVALLFLFVSVYTLQAWDLVMALDPAWSSTVLGAFYFVSNLYLGLAVLTVLTIAAAPRLRPDKLPVSEVRTNLGKLLFSFSMLWAYLVWSQYLVVWYGNLPWEAEFILLRTARPPWSGIALAALAMCALAPFVVLLSRSAKRNPSVLLGVSLSIAAGIWLERFLLVVPSLGVRSGRLFGWQELLIAAGFLACFAASWLVAMRRGQSEKERGRS